MKVFILKTSIVYGMYLQKVKLLGIIIIINGTCMQTECLNSQVMA